MFEFSPFRALRYAGDRASETAKLVAPPYDVVSKSEQAAYHEQSPYNILHIELTDERLYDNEGDKYQRAKQLWREWIANGTLALGEEPAFYVYRQTFEVDHQSYQRVSLIGRASLHPFGEGPVLPHEKTLSAPKVDRLQLMQATQANISPIFGLYPDPNGIVKKHLKACLENEPLLNVEDAKGEGHELWILDDAEAIAEISNFLYEEKVYIADGHHRYETAIAYRDLQRVEKGEGPWDQVMMALVDLADPGLVILPTHRLLHSLSSFDEAQLLKQLEAYFSIDHYDDVNVFLAELKRCSAFSATIGLYAGNKYHLLQLMNHEALHALLPEHSVAYQHLNVVALETLVFRKFLGLNEKNIAEQTNLSYTKDIAEAITSARTEKYQLACLLGPIRITEMKDVADAGEFMPQKSTFFYPKLITGLVMNPLDDA